MNIKIKYSSSKRYNEGEIKILKYLEYNLIKYPKSSNIIISNDSDFIVIFLCNKFIENKTDIYLAYDNYNTFSFKKFCKIENLNKKIQMLNIALIILMYGNDYFPKISYLYTDFTKYINTFKSNFKVLNKSLCYLDEDRILLNLENYKQYLAMAENKIINKKNKNNVNVKTYLSLLMWCINNYYHVNLKSNCNKLFYDKIYLDDVVNFNGKLNYNYSEKTINHKYYPAYVLDKIYMQPKYVNKCCIDYYKEINNKNK